MFEYNLATILALASSISLKVNTVKSRLLG